MLLFIPFLCMGCSSIISMLWIIVLPFYASFCGPEAVLRLSVLMGIHSSLSSLIPASVISAIPVTQLGLACVLLALPVNLSPYIMVWLYDKVIWLSEPLLLTIEAIQVVRYTMYSSNKVIAKIEDEPSLAKLLILGLAGTSYAVSVFICVLLRSEEHPVTRWLIVTLWLIAFAILVFGIVSEAGNILDVSVITLVMFSILWAMQQELKMSKNPIQTPQVWYSDELDRRSFLHLFYSIIVTSAVQIANISQGVMFLYKLMSLSFLLVVVVRVVSILHAVSLIPPWNNEESESYADEDEDMTVSSLLNWKSPLLIKLALIFTYTQLVVYNVERHSSKDALGGDLYQGLLANLGLARLCQIFVLVGVYFYRLYYADDFIAGEL